jgi:hypothetical protein
MRRVSAREEGKETENLVMKGKNKRNTAGVSSMSPTKVTRDLSASEWRINEYWNLSKEKKKNETLVNLQSTDVEARKGGKEKER